jgi:D-sedoheptulose 7-phosphate isomerase
MVQTAAQVSGSTTAEYLARLANLLDRVPHETIAEVVSRLLAARASGRRVYVMGNGGSSATATHLVCDLVKTASVPGLRPLRAYALADNTALLTAWANDTAYDRIFAEQLDSLIDPGDLVIAISASGNSPNIVAGLESALARGADTVALVGFDGGAAARLAEITIHIPAHDYGLVEDSHSAIGHAITAAVNRALLESAQ